MNKYKKAYEELKQTFVALTIEKVFLQNALDKACEKLESFDETSEKHWKKEKWKEWCMK